MITRPSIRSWSVLVSTVLLATITTALAANSSRRPVDDPPPEPVDCPMCGGNPQVHAQRMLGLEAHQGRLLAYALRW
jgi:hypothetical protein